MPAFPTFTGEDSSVSSRDHIFKFSNHCVAYEGNPNYKLRLFGNSLAGLASQWYSLLPPNSIANWGQMEMAFHEQFYRIEPELTINYLVEVKQYDHKSTEDFMMRFSKTRMRCQFPVNQAQLISIAQRDEVTIACFLALQEMRLWPKNTITTGESSVHRKTSPICIRPSCEALSACSEPNTRINSALEISQNMLDCLKMNSY
ncbi:hypothetical protein ACFX13_033912 [Malus domestica]